MPHLNSSKVVEQETGSDTTVVLNVEYATVRHGVKSTVYPIELRNREVVVKDKLIDTHSRGIPRAKFDKYYQQVK